MPTDTVRRLCRFFILVSTSLIIPSCTSEYKEHFWSYHSTGGTTSPSYNLAPESIDLLVLPDKSIHTDLIDAISKSQERVWVEIYTWTDKWLRDALIAAKRRGVDVKVILEPNVFGSPKINTPTYDAFIWAEIDVVYSDIYRFRFTHAKFFLLDDDVYISTWNFTRSFFEKNRDIIIHMKDDKMKSFFQELFLRDFFHHGTENLTIPDLVVISPLDSRKKILSLLSEAKTHILVYTQSLQDEEILELLVSKFHEWVQIDLCTARNESNEKSIEDDWPFDWILVATPYPHLKTIVIDGKKVFIGSQNFTQNSLDNNREVGMVIQENAQIVRTVMGLYENDCKR